MTEIAAKDNINTCLLVKSSTSFVLSRFSLNFFFICYSWIRNEANKSVQWITAKLSLWCVGCTFVPIVSACMALQMPCDLLSHIHVTLHFGDAEQNFRICFVCIRFTVKQLIVPMCHTRYSAQAPTIQIAAVFSFMQSLQNHDQDQVWNMKPFCIWRYLANMQNWLRACATDNTHTMHAFRDNF